MCGRVCVGVSAFFFSLSVEIEKMEKQKGQD